MPKRSQQNYSSQSTASKKMFKSTIKPRKAKPTYAFKKAIEKIVQGQAEMKYKDTVSSYNGVATAGSTPLLLNGITQADDVTQRNGREIKMRSIHIKGACILCDPANPTNPIQGDMLRVAIVIDSQPNGATIAATDVYDTSTTSFALAFRQIATYKKRFKVLRDILIPQKGIGSATAGPDTMMIDEYIDLSNVPDQWTNVIYGGTGNTISSITKNSVFLMYGNHVINADDLLPNGFSYNVRVKYTDI